MRPSAVAISLVLLGSACSPTTVAPTSTSRTSSATPAPSARSSATPAPAATSSATAVPLATSTATVWAQACGTVSEFVQTTPTTDGFVLSSPGRPPLRITTTGGRPNVGRGVSGYVCVALDAGVPAPVLAGFGVPNTASYIPEGTYPATSAMPAPNGFVVPQLCAYVAPPAVGTEQIEWKVDCGGDANRDARGTLGAALVQQGWTACGPATASERFVKGTLQIVVVESSLSPGDYPRFDQLDRAATGCSG